jgi:adenosylcobinamide kinase / adenosylcobinamide-phosphate guanylyltransferase
MTYLITGGERSGKSSYAQQLALSLTNKPVYIATSRKWDQDFVSRIEHHKQERDSNWTTIEEEKFLSKCPIYNRVAVIDCVTLWLVNFFSDCRGEIQQSLTEAKNELDKLFDIPSTLLIVSNEIGMGVHAQTETGRKFVELQGWINQYIAAKADHVVLMISGIPLTIK